MYEYVHTYIYYRYTYTCVPKYMYASMYKNFSLKLHSNLTVNKASDMLNQKLKFSNQC